MSTEGRLYIDGADTESRIRESLILAGCLTHPDLATDFEDRPFFADHRPVEKL